MRYIRRGIAFLLLLALLFTTALAEAPFLRHSDGWTLEGVPLEAVLSAEVTSLMPYDEDRLAMLTPVTDVLSLRLRAGEEQGSVTILVGRTEALRLSYQGDEAQVSCIPEMSFRSQEDVVDKLLGNQTRPRSGSSLPKGLNPRTMAAIRTVLEQGSGSIHTCESISAASGLSRVTVRHYLNYLIDTGELTSTIDYETGGRPRVLYRVN